MPPLPLFSFPSKKTVGGGSPFIPVTKTQNPTGHFERSGDFSTTTVSRRRNFHESNAVPKCWPCLRVLSENRAPLIVSGRDEHCLTRGTTCVFTTEPVTHGIEGRVPRHREPIHQGIGTRFVQIVACPPKTNWPFKGESFDDQHPVTRSSSQTKSAQSMTRPLILIDSLNLFSRRAILLRRIFQ